MKILTILVVAVASLAGCKKTNAGDELKAQMTHLKDAMCKCTDKACADKVQADLVKWAADSAKTVAEAKKPDEELNAAMKAISLEYKLCMAKVTGTNP